MLKPLLTCLGLGLGLMTVSATALAQAQPQTQTPTKPPRCASALDRAHRVVEILRNSNSNSNNSSDRASPVQHCQHLECRSTFDVMGAASDHHTHRVAHVNARFDARQKVALMRSMGRGVVVALQ